MIQKRKRIIKRKIPWWKKNLNYITIIILGLLLIQSMRGCLSKTEYQISEKKVIKERDSIYNIKNQQIIDLQNILDQSQDENQRLIYELKIAGVKAFEAEKRALAIQSTAEKIKQNTIITIEADTTKNKIR